MTSVNVIYCKLEQPLSEINQLKYRNLCEQIIPFETLKRIRQCIRPDDYLRNTVSQLLQRLTISRECNLAINQIHIQTTNCNIPAHVQPKLGPRINHVRIKPTALSTKRPFHFNITHDANLVALVHSDEWAVGIDVMKVVLPNNHSKKTYMDEEDETNEFLNSMNDGSSISQNEWNYIHCALTAKEKLKRFFLIWTLKESYTKAVGTGLFDFDQTECKLRSDITSEFPTFDIFKNGTIVDSVIYKHEILEDNYMVCITLMPVFEVDATTLEYISNDVLNTSKRNVPNDFELNVKNTMVGEIITECYEQLKTPHNKPC